MLAPYRGPFWRAGRRTTQMVNCGGERVDERTAVAQVDGEHLVAVWIGDAVAADAFHRLVGLAFIDDRLRDERSGADVVEPDLVVIGVGHLLNQIQALTIVTERVEAEVAVDLDADERITQKARTNQEIRDDATASVLALARQRQPLSIRREARARARISEVGKRVSGRDRGLRQRPPGGRIDGGKPSGPAQLGDRVVTRPVGRGGPDRKLARDISGRRVANRNLLAAV